MFAVPLDIHSLLRTMAGAQWIAAYPQPLPCFCPGCPRGALCLVRSDTNEQPLTLAFRVRGFLHFQRQGYGRSNGFFASCGSGADPTILRVAHSGERRRKERGKTCKDKAGNLKSRPRAGNPHKVYDPPARTIQKCQGGQARCRLLHFHTENRAVLESTHDDIAVIPWRH